MINAEDGEEITVLIDPYLVTKRGKNFGKPYGEDGYNSYTGRLYRPYPSSYLCKLERSDGFIIFDYDDALQLTQPV